MEELNKLTIELLDAGYTMEHYPDYVKLPYRSLGSVPDKKLFYIHGGFQYKSSYIDNMVFKTGCGKYVKGDAVMELSCGIEWSQENDNPVIFCPFYKNNCIKNDDRLNKVSSGTNNFCVCHKTDELYDYENSIDKVINDNKNEKDIKFNEFIKSKEGRACKTHMYYDNTQRQWSQHYFPSKCVNNCHNTFCPILQKELAKEKGNVYYDLKTSFIRKDGTFFDGEEIVTIKKGIRFFEKPVSMDICKSFIKLESYKIYEKYKMNNSIFFMNINDFKAEIINIRAESKPSRDLIKDLEDIRDGITIYHDSDLIKKSSAEKKLQRYEIKEKKIKKLEKKILDIGYENLPITSLERSHADKWFTPEQLNNLSEKRVYIQEQQLKSPKQLSLFDGFI